jgi:hypothetical protein
MMPVMMMRQAMLEEVGRQQWAWPFKRTFSWTRTLNFLKILSKIFVCVLDTPALSAFNKITIPWFLEISH